MYSDPEKWLNGYAPSPAQASQYPMPTQYAGSLISEARCPKDFRNSGLSVNVNTNPQTPPMMSNSSTRTATPPSHYHYVHHKAGCTDSRESGSDNEYETRGDFTSTSPTRSSPTMCSSALLTFFKKITTKNDSFSGEELPLKKSSSAAAADGGHAESGTKSNGTPLNRGSPLRQKKRAAAAGGGSDNLNAFLMNRSNPNVYVRNRNTMYASASTMSNSTPQLRRGHTLSDNNLKTVGGGAKAKGSVSSPLRGGGGMSSPQRGSMSPPNRGSMGAMKSACSQPGGSSLDYAQRLRRTQSATMLSAASRIVSTGKNQPLPTTEGSRKLSRPRVCVRIRPLLSREMKEPIVTKASSYNEVCTTDPFTGEKQIYEYDHVFDQHATQESVYHALGRPAVQCVLDGVSSCIFAHGQTGTGKTHSMVGTPGLEALGCGLLPRMTKELLSLGTLKLTMIEIYRDQVRDLLGGCAEHRPEIRKHPKRGAYIDNAREGKITCLETGLVTISEGLARRMEAATAMNERSSRGHCVVTLTTPSGAKLCCVDLAGRENDKTTLEKNPDRLAELNFINVSLFHLTQVITAIRTKQPSVPFRNSKLTLLLHDCLQTQQTFVLACLSPAASAFEDSRMTLRMADTTRHLPAGKARLFLSPTRRPPSRGDNIFHPASRVQQSSLLLPSDLPVSAGIAPPMRLLRSDPRFINGATSGDSSDIRSARSGWSGLKGLMKTPKSYRHTVSETTTRASFGTNSTISSDGHYSLIPRWIQAG